MASRARLWHVLNAGLCATPTGVVGDKRTRGESERSEERSEELSEELSELSEEEQSKERADLSPADVELLATNMRVTIKLTPTWQPEHRDFSHNFEYSNAPLVRYNREWDIPEFRMAQEPAREVELTGTLDRILVQLKNGTPERPPAFNAQHFSIHLAACQAALFRHPELLNNLDEKFRSYVGGDNFSPTSLISLILVYNAVSQETDRYPIVDAYDLNAMGLSDQDIYRFWHQARSLLADLMESSGVSREGGESGTRTNVADFVSRMMIELDLRVPARSFGGAQQMDW